MARLYRMAVPRSCSVALSDRRQVTATFVVTLMLLNGRVVCGACHSEM